MTNRVLAFLALTALSLFPTASALERVPGTYTYYSASVDPITDVNTGLVMVDEVNDLTGDTFLSVKCANYGQPELWAAITSKNPLYDTGELDMPGVTIRIGSAAPQFVGPDVVSPVGNEQRNNAETIGLPTGISREIAAGLFRGDTVTVRVERAPAVGRQTLTFQFPGKGFSTAWNAVGRCRQGAAPAPAAPAASGRAAQSTEAPRYLRWYFTTCTDTQSGAVRSQLLSGRTHRCQLIIETVPNGAEPVSASFSYELEYVQGGRTQTLRLPGSDTWAAGGSGPVAYRRSGSNLVFNLPLNVNRRAERRYTFITVTGQIRFSNGSTKAVQEKLPVVY